MFTAKDIIGNAVDAAVAAFLTLPRGVVIPWGEIEAVAGFDRESPHWRQFDKRWRRRFLRTTGVHLGPVNGVGLKLLTTQEQLHDRSVMRHRKAYRQLHREAVELAALPDAELTTHQRDVKHRKIDRVQEVQRVVSASNNLAHLLARPSSSGMPRPTN